MILRIVFFLLSYFILFRTFYKYYSMSGFKFKQNKVFFVSFSAIIFFMWYLFLTVYEYLKVISKNPFYFMNLM